MKTKLIFFTLILFLLVPSVKAHRLNEYLQATTISLGKHNISLHMHLTAGSDIAHRILLIMDPNGDGIISTAEQQAYATLVLRNLHLSVDNHQVPLRILSWTFSTVDEIKKGMGDIHLYVAGEGIPYKTATHHLTFENHLQQAISVYLVNCLLPADTSIHVTGQSRNNEQSLYSLDFTTAGYLQPGVAERQQVLDKTDKQAIIKTYFFKGVGHILTGYDHLLFICALVLGATGLWNLIKNVTAFTIAHSITLALATFGLAHLPEYIVEPVISASIVFVAVQNIFWPQHTRGAGRLAAAFIFGLFHGLGFAGGLLEVMHAMPTQLVFYAILGFSLGVEGGNQLVLLPLYGVLQTERLLQPKAVHPRRGLTFQRSASCVVALAGTYYLIIALT